MRERLSPVARRALLEKLHDYRRTAWEDGYRAGYEAAAVELARAEPELQPGPEQLEEGAGR
jgi:hypothetical protein